MDSVELSWGSPTLAETWISDSNSVHRWASTVAGATTATTGGTKPLSLRVVSPRSPSSDQVRLDRNALAAPGQSPAEVNCCRCNALDSLTKLAKPCYATLSRLPEGFVHVVPS